VRRCWISTRPTNRANAYKGLGRLIHDLSHQCFAAHYPTRRAHDPLHAYYETQIAAYVAASGWMKRMTDPPKAKVKVAALRLQEAAKTEAAIKRWEGKRRRAETALRKYRRKLKRLSRPTASA
jgi:hypothetical protein